MRKHVPSAEIYAWAVREEPFLDGRVHAKVAVADGLNAFITSANLTGYALEKNMEAGVLISGGSVPNDLQNHLAALAETGIITKVA
jgi:phosphatidylserine/phosphatidylglycerophosphate/cardiolipin synthase-like enzyme